MASEDHTLRRFSRHCRVFYDSSLILHPSDSSLSSLQEEKKADENPLDVNHMKKRAADGKIVLESLDRIIAIRSIAVTIEQQQQQQQKIIGGLQNSIDTLRQEHTLIIERHHDVLSECGLLDIDRFIEPSCRPKNDDRANGEDDTAPCLLRKYTETRDAMRRRAHKVSMLQRQNSLFELLDDSITAETGSPTSSEPDMTRVENVQRNLSLIQIFVQKYQTNIGAHSFLAGLYRIVHMQLHPKPNGKKSCKDPSYVVQWKFRGSVLTEACCSCHGKNNENEYDELAYARQAIEVLFSFLIWVKDIDMEVGGLIVPIDEHEFDADSSNGGNKVGETKEPILSFEIDKHISNANLRRILAVLPDPKRLDARATGSVEVLDSSGNDSGLSNRKNVDGQEDEPWPWFSRLEFCTLL